MMSKVADPNRYHAAAEMYAEELKAGKLSRREFLARVTALGVTTAAAYSLGGLQRPAIASGDIKQGGTLMTGLRLQCSLMIEFFEQVENTDLEGGRLSQSTKFEKS